MLAAYLKKRGLQQCKNWKAVGQFRYQRYASKLEGQEIHEFLLPLHTSEGALAQLFFLRFSLAGERLKKGLYGSPKEQIFRSFCIGDRQAKTAIICEGLEDALTLALQSFLEHKAPSYHAVMGTAGLGCADKPPRQECVLLLDRDTEDQSWYASEHWCDGVERLIPGMAQDANAAHLAGQFEEWVEGLKDAEPPPPKEQRPKKNTETPPVAGAQASPPAPADFFDFDERGKARIDYFKFGAYMAGLGLYLEKVGDGEDTARRFVHIQKGIGRYIDRIDLGNVVIDSCDPAIGQLLLRGHKTYFSEAVLSRLLRLDRTPLEDRKGCSYFFYQNCAVRVDQQGKTAIPYEQIAPHFVWAKSITKRKYEPQSQKITGVFEQFLRHTSTFADVLCDETLRRKKLALGYMLHRHKAKDQVRAVIAVDRNLDPESMSSNGRTGKGLFFQAIRACRSDVYIDGKTWDFDDRFRYQNVQPNSEVMLFDDVEKKFDFSKLFNVLAEDLVVESKGKKKWVMDFADSPKIGITSNHPLKGSGTSYESRQYMIEFSDYYNDRVTPSKIAGGNFFSEDWDEAEWNATDAFIHECCQLYFQEGLEQGIPTEYKTAKIKADMGVDLYNFCLSDVQECKQIEDRKVYFDDYCYMYDDKRARRTIHRLHTQLCEFLGVRKEERHSNGKTGIFLSKGVP